MFYMNQFIQSFDLSTFITNSVVDFYFMFYGCAGVNVKNSKYLNSMFEGCIALKNITTGNFKTSSAIDISTMLKDCSSVSSLDLNKFNTNIVIYSACFIIVQDYPL